MLRYVFYSLVRLDIFTLLISPIQILRLTDTAFSTVRSFLESQAMRDFAVEVTLPLVVSRAPRAAAVSDVRSNRYKRQTPKITEHSDWSHSKNISHVRSSTGQETVGSMLEMIQWGSVGAL